MRRLFQPPPFIGPGIVVNAICFVILTAWLLLLCAFRAEGANTAIDHFTPAGNHASAAGNDLIGDHNPRSVVLDRTSMERIDR